MWYWWKKRNVDQWDKIGNPEIDLQNIVTWSLTTRQKQLNGQCIVFATNGTTTSGHPNAKTKNK